MKDNLDSLVETISQLNAMQDADNDQRAVELYRAADHILEYVEFGVEKAEVDYKNYLRYLKMISPVEYLSHLDMFNEAIRSRDDENFVEDEK